jgi:2-polyprenyl-6-methoxyphenol hydroxylase-like FAD-dependent oxidoreductase
VVQRVEETDAVIVEYKQSAEGPYKTDNRRYSQQLRARWLVGADGKTGVVRKYFLEPAGITQQVGKYAYTGTWIAANLEISLPTPQTHPDLPFWPLGLSPEEVYDIFWPKDWHFCTHPKEAVATGRFGPEEERLWRHEFELDCAWKDDMDALALFWKNLTPHITHDGSSILCLSEPVGYPKDCVKVLRCRPFTFVQKVAGPLWHHNRTIIIGDAAHVFPPFGGQGIASGVRDAVGLSWRLAILTKLQLKGGSATADAMLENWCRERRQGVDDSADVTMTNGRLTAQKWRAMAYLQVAVGTVLCKIPWLLNMATKNIFRDDLGYSKAKNGFFLPHQRGGCKLSQIYVQRDSVGKPVLSDSIVCRACPLVTILVISTGKETPAIVSKVKKIVRAAETNPLLVSDGSICVFDPANSCEEAEATRYSPCTLVELERHEVKPFPGYDEKTFLRRLGTGTKFAIIRPDAIIFSLCKNVEELETALKEMKELIS